MALYCNKRKKKKIVKISVKILHTFLIRKRTMKECYKTRDCTKYVFMIIKVDIYLLFLVAYIKFQRRTKKNKIPLPPLKQEPMEIFDFSFSFQDKIRLLQDDLESERELRQRVSIRMNE